MLVTMQKDKETKNAIRYSEPKRENDPHVKTIYLTKEELKAEFSEIPETLKVEITKA